MPNTACPACCNPPRSRVISLFGQSVAVRNTRCSADGIHYLPKAEPLRLHLSIELTQFCNARCPFCIAAPTVDPQRLSLSALREVLLRLREADCVRGISFTGGEPFTDPERLDRALSLVFDIFGQEMEVAIDTNGTGLRHLPHFRDLVHVAAVHISRHHWDDGRNEALFGRPMPRGEEIAEIIARVNLTRLFVMNCMLLRGWVETPEDAHRYLNFALEAGAFKVAFITGAAVNPWIAGHLVPFEEVLLPSDSDMLYTRGYQDYELCHCQDGVYVGPGGRLIEFYGRETANKPCDYTRGLVLYPDGRLTLGFRGPAVFQASGT